MTYQHFALICGHPSVDEVVPPSERLSMADALEEVFASDNGLLIMQWNGIFVPLDYKYDVSWIFSDVIGMLEKLTDPHQGESIDVSFPSNGFNADWRLSLVGSDLVVEAVWREVNGSLLELLTDRSPLTIDRSRFVQEWLKLVGIVVRSLDKLGFGSEHVYDYDRLIKVLDTNGSTASDA